MYHVVGTSIIASLLYITSYVLVRIGFYTNQFHKKFWNSLLAFAFMITAAAGLFMALQVNHKWDVPFVKSILKWHVEFGIGMAVTGLFHLALHFSYFTKMFRKDEAALPKSNFQNLSASVIATNLFIVGFISSSIQLLLIREMMNIAGGYELITGIFLGSWLITSAMGASLGGRSDMTDIRKINIAFSISPLVSLLLLFLLSRLFLNTGETPSIMVSILYTFIVLLPFCFVSGFTFIRLISAARSADNFTPGKSFSIETTGGIMAGIAISFFSSGFLNTYQLLFLIILLGNIYVYLTFRNKSQAGGIAVKILGVLLSSALIIFNPDPLFRQLLLPGISVTSSEDTPYGNITKGNYKGDESIYYNQRLLSYKDDVAEREEDIHYALLQHDNPHEVIMISGALRSHLPEILKYHPEKIIYIERDPALTRSVGFLKDSLPSALVIENDDAFSFIRKQREKADDIILLMPPPSTLLLNRYFTTEFFAAAKKNLSSNGIFVCSPGPGEDYMNRESINLYSAIYNSLSAVFRNVLPIAGNKLYFLASDGELSSLVCQLAEARKIRNIYVSSDFLADDLITKKSNEIISLIDPGIRQNKSAFPIACFHFQSYTFSKNLDEKTPLLVILFMLFSVPVLTIKRRSLPMYFSASALAGFEIIILLTLQIIVGNMYQVTGLIIAGLMTGLALGSGFGPAFLNNISLRRKSVILMCFYLGAGLLFNFIISLKGGFPAIALLIITVILPAILTGNIFRQLTLKPEVQSLSSAVYSADLAGSAFGFILITGLAVPVFGIKVSIFILTALIFAGILLGTVRNK